MKKFILMLAISLGGIFSAQAQNTTFDFSCAAPAELFTPAQQDELTVGGFIANPAVVEQGIWSIDLEGQYLDETIQANIRLVEGQFAVDIEGEGSDGQATFAVLEDAIAFANTFNYTTTSFAGYQRVRMVAAGFTQGRYQNDNSDEYFPLPNHYVDQFQVGQQYGSIAIDFVSLNQIQVTVATPSGTTEEILASFDAALASAIASRNGLTN